jgi:hypothetical protein
MSLDTLQVETDRLVLRLPRAEDLDPWADMMADSEVARFIGGVTARTVSWRALMMMIGAWHAHGFAMFSVVEKSTGRWVGRLGPWMPEGWPDTEVGWAIVRDCWPRVRHRRRSGRDRLGFRSSRLDARHPLHRPGEPGIARRRSKTGLAQPRARSVATSFPGFTDRHLGTVARGLARAATLSRSRA